MTIMKLTKCDNHPDRDAKTTFYVKNLTPGARPILMRYHVGDKFIDLCEECASPILKAKEKTGATER